MGWMNEVENLTVKGWCLAGKEKRVGEGEVSSPTTVKKPPSASSSGSWGGDTESMPTSRREDGCGCMTWIGWVVGAK